MINDFSACLMLSCHNEKHLQKIPTLDAQCIMLNLEDGVSKEAKPKALELCCKYLELYKELDIMFVVRVNALDEGGLDEILKLNPYHPDAIRVAKIKTKEDVQTALDALSPQIKLHLSIETAQAWNNLATLRVHPRVTTFYLGVLDLFAELNLPQSIIKPTNSTMQYILSHFLVTSLSIGVKPVSFVFQEYKNLDIFQQWLELEKQMGYRAKGCISPTQVSLANAVFKQDNAELKKAKKIIELFEKQKSLGITGFSDEEFGFIDEPIYKGALAILDR